MVLSWIRQKLTLTASDKEEDLNIEGQENLRVIGTATAEGLHAEQQPSETQETIPSILEALVPECNFPDVMELKVTYLEHLFQFRQMETTLLSEHLLMEIQMVLLELYKFIKIME